MGVRNNLMDSAQHSPTCCRTPGAVYTTAIRPRVIAAFIHAPANVDLFDRLSPKQEREFIADLHNAILPVIEGVYRNVWDRLAGKYLRDCGDKPMPERWEDLAPPAAEDRARGAEGGEASR